MSKAEIIAELPKLTTDELADVQARLDELAGEAWLDCGELSDADKSALDAALAEYQKNPEAGSSWQDVESRIRAKRNR
jgi:hypothetical protein